jgi:isopenicillin N synthase-like dioxygenase
MGSINTDSQEPPKTALPIIDFAKWSSSSAPLSDRLNLAKELVSACHQTGFVYLTNHGISPSLLSEAFSWAKRFYALPTEQKMQAGHPDGSTAFRGYCWPGLERGSTVYPGSELVNGDEPKLEEESMDFTVSLSQDSFCPTFRC